MHRDVATLMRHACLQEARLGLARFDAETLSNQAALSAIPAPTGAEALRAASVGERMRGIGLAAVATDEAGNVTGWLGDRAKAPAVVVAAHLDTVFGPEVDVRVHRAGDRLSGPGISDNARGLAGMLALGRVMATHRLDTLHPIAFVATVGEEGAGDLKGIKHLMLERRLDARAVLVLDGAGDDRVVHAALGSRRFRMTYAGPGGHSWAAFGAPNPAHAAGALAEQIGRWPRGRTPRTACSVVGLSGGTALNCIPEEARVEIDLRSEDPAALAAAEREVLARAREALVLENGRRAPGTPTLNLSVEIIGDRPSGVTPENDPLVVASIEATRAIGREPSLVTASTDANIPISMGIPAITIGAGGRGGDPHRLTEWYENKDGALGLYRALLILGAAAGLPEE